MSGWLLIGGALITMCALALLIWTLRPNELDEDQARKIIAMTSSEPVTVPLATRESVFAVNIPLDRATGAFTPFHQEQINQVRNRLERIRDAGFITFEEEIVSRSLFSSRLGNVVFLSKPTNKLEPYIIGSSPSGATLEIKIGEVVPDQITAIVHATGEARIVRYSKKVEFNELSNLFETGDVPIDLTDSETRFSKVNDEWKISE
jgi:hypothetical protein